MKITNKTDNSSTEYAGSIKSTLLFILALLFLAIAFGVGSGFWAYSQGTKALEGVKSPDDNPTKKLTGKLKENPAKQPYLLDEKKLIKEFSAMANKPQNVEKTTPEKSETEKDSSTKDKEKQKEKEKENKIESDLSLSTQKDNVTLDLLKVRREGNSLTLDVNLRNDGSQPVRFLYSFLEVRDDRNRALSAITDGLPSDLPNGGEIFSGTIRIPTALLDNVKSLSLTLTDYPDQKIELKIDNIPIIE
jgi:hypothetical protein